MDQDKKHVIPRHLYKRKRREFFHNEEREARLKAEKEENALKAEKEKAQVKNNEERVKDNLRKARIEKITHDDGDKSQNKVKHETEPNKEASRPIQETSSVSINGSEAEQSNHKDAETQQERSEQVQSSKQVDDKENQDDHQDAMTETPDKHQQEHPPKHQYSTKRDWTEKITQFLSREWAKILIILAIILVVILLFAIFNNVNKSENDNVKQAIQEQQHQKGTNKTVTKTMENANLAVKSVVSIENNSKSTPDTVQDAKQQTQEEKESGSGVVYKKVDDTLYILTNAHVVGDREKHELTFGDHQTAMGKVIGKDKWSDLAIMTVHAPKGDVLKPIKQGDSSALILGEPVIVVGNPLSLDFQNTVGEGIVSGLNRDVPVDIDKDNEYDTLLSAFQVDAPINPGDSGGAVVDQNGELIGIASLKISMPNVQSMGFAIPINQAIHTAKLLEKDGEIKHPNTHLQLDNVIDVTDATKDDYNVNKSLTEGVMVSNIDDDSSAQNSGLKKGDVIVELDGKPVKDKLAYRQKLFEHTNLKEALKLKVIREGEVKQISYKLN